jgi:hypothetical protein
MWHIRLTTLPPSVSQLSRENVGASMSHNSMGLHNLLQGQLLPSSSLNTGYTQKNCAVSKVNIKFISQLTGAQHTLSDAATVQVSRALIRNLQCVHPWSHDTHPHSNQTHPRSGVACK